MNINNKEYEKIGLYELEKKECPERESNPHPSGHNA